MKTMSFEEHKEIELDILSNVADFCDKNELRYYLAYGTLIGAIRHKGFIPWDDDIDIWMPRDDYNKLMEIYNNFDNGPYKLITPYDKVSRHTFVKIVNTLTVKKEAEIDYKNGFLGVDIDVFPLDGQPDDQIKYEKWYDKLQKYYKFYPYLILSHNNKIKRKIAFPIIRLLSGGKNNILNKTKKLHCKYPYEKCTYVGSIECCYDYIELRYKKEWFDDFVFVEFENKKFKAPAEYHKILTQTYGDYMTLPPVEKRITHHSNKVYWL